MLDSADAKIIEGPVARQGSPLPVTEELAETNVALPMSPALGAGEAEQVVAAVAAAL